VRAAKQRIVRLTLLRLREARACYRPPSATIPSLAFLTLARGRATSCEGALIGCEIECYKVGRAFGWKNDSSWQVGHVKAKSSQGAGCPVLAESAADWGALLAAKVGRGRRDGLRRWPSTLASTFRGGGVFKSSLSNGKRGKGNVPVCELAALTGCSTLALSSLSFDVVLFLTLARGAANLKVTFIHR
jgi:hypothetical protein